jgi:hypothetical protein
MKFIIILNLFVINNSVLILFYLIQKDKSIDCKE